jgi:ribosomal protein S18 acetylase RimI-like enzyme
MDENPFRNRLTVPVTPGETKGMPEKLHVETRMAGPEDWEAYKKIRLEAITGEDAGMFGPKGVARDKTKSDQEWQKDLSQSENMFTVLSWNGSEVISLGNARKKEEKGFWHMGSAYVKPEFRGGNGRKMLEFIIQEIINRGGSKIEVGVRPDNERSIRLCESLGFKKVGMSDGWQMLELSLVE